MSSHGFVIAGKGVEPKTWTEIIRCPNCGSIETAIVTETPLWNIYVHDCIKCGFTIMESEWERVEQNEEQK
jgi:Zn ribbon nucleic-acid-binding protein